MNPDLDEDHADEMKELPHSEQEQNPEEWARLPMIMSSQCKIKEKSPRLRPYKSV